MAEYADGMTAEQVVAMEYEGYLKSDDLNPAWVAGWHAAINHAVHALKTSRRIPVAEPSLPFACCAHCECRPDDRTGHDDSCLACQNPDGTPLSSTPGSQEASDGED